MSHKKHSGEEFISGLVCTLIFGYLFFGRSGSIFWLFPFAFAGVLPLIKGLTGILTKRALIKSEKEAHPENNIATQEKQILTLAKEMNGKLTPALIALETSLSIDEAEKSLQDMTKRGYANMEIRSSGGIEYIFTEFLPKINED